MDLHLLDLVFGLVVSGEGAGASAAALSRLLSAASCSALLLFPFLIPIELIDQITAQLEWRVYSWWNFLISRLEVEAPGWL